MKINESQTRNIHEVLGRCIATLDRYRNKLLSQENTDLLQLEEVSFNIGELKALKRFFGEEIQ